ncbi:hypothetical protein D081_1675 [Anaerovibrio sp. JC8]|uniref:hypothetical protein n=1 Tax=Anaerovibrio sp. JC8 TaxID=1240085 RepID=UPI000A0DF4BC|nr:hypothetical protein [Anaerovibrio sp. JC8]ORT99791.1 hypothetical protein D081_1675 [Anaerovibrio sp. JC8]
MKNNILDELANILTKYPAVIASVVLVYVFLRGDGLYDYVGSLLAIGALVILIFCLRIMKMPDETWLEKEKEKRLQNPYYKIKEKPAKNVIILVIIASLAMGAGGITLKHYNGVVTTQEQLEDLDKKIASLDEKDREAFNSVYDKKWDGTSKEVKFKRMAYDQIRKQVAERLDLTHKIVALDEKGKAIFDGFYDSKWDGTPDENKYKKEAYNKTINIIEEEKQKVEEEKKELQKKYDDQAKYEEWVAWKKAEEAKSAQAAEQQRIKDNTISMGDSPSKVERVKGSPKNVTKSTNALGTVLVYTYLRNGYDYSNGVVIYEFVNSELVNITESH